MEAMTEEEISVMVKHWHHPMVHRLIYTYAVAKAEAERLAHVLHMHNGCEPKSEEDCEHVNLNWVDDVLTRIGWPQDGWQGEKNDET